MTQEDIIFVNENDCCFVYYFVLFFSKENPIFFPTVIIAKNKLSDCYVGITNHIRAK